MNMIWKKKEKHDKSNFNRLKITPKYEKEKYEKLFQMTKHLQIFTNIVIYHNLF